MRNEMRHREAGGRGMGQVATTWLAMFTANLLTVKEMSLSDNMS